MLIPIGEVIPFLEKSLNAKIIDYATTPLTAKGENYGSTMLSVKIKVKFDDAKRLLNDDVSSEFLFLLVFQFVLNAVFTNDFIITDKNT